MPELLRTEHVTTHTVTFTSLELESLREAARAALSAAGGVCVHTRDWQALSRLGLPATRTRPLTSSTPTPTGP